MSERVDGCDQKGFHTDVNQAGHGARRVVGVQRGENQMAGQGYVDGDGRGLQVANFTDHDNVRRLAQNRAQRGGERQADDFADLHLVDAAQNVFHRVFDGDDFPVRTVDEVEAGI